MADKGNEWFDDYAEPADDVQIAEYEIVSAPNDFNILTIYSFLESGSVKIPGFQRNFVWDLGRASKLIESLILGLPVPQIFLYEKDRNQFVVIDGQQRLMSVYYFLKQRFPKKEKRGELRRIFDEKGTIPDELLHDDNFFQDFKLKLSGFDNDHPNRFNKLNYKTLGDHKAQFELRTIRNIIIKQSSPQGDDSSMYEVFNRLNTGGINLKPQEIRTSMYHSEFYVSLYRLNSDSAWRRILGVADPDLHMKDVEVLLRGLALLVDGENYAPSMVSFLNQFSRRCRSLERSKADYLTSLFHSFLKVCQELPDDAFIRNGRFNVALYEAVFVAVCGQAFKDIRQLMGRVSHDKLKLLESDPEFRSALQEGTTQTKSVRRRLERARAIVGAL